MTSPSRVRRHKWTEIEDARLRAAVQVCWATAAIVTCMGQCNVGEENLVKPEAGMPAASNAAVFKDVVNCHPA